MSDMTRVRSQEIAPEDTREPHEGTCDRGGYGSPHCEGPCGTLHTCPYRVEINGDNETLCNCCGECEGECGQDV